jgi:colanic acid biosynthesis glycosyl transferase WcaI
LPAGVDTALFSPQAADPSLGRALGLHDSFTIGYAGLHGLWQSLDTVVDAASVLRDRGDIGFALIGEGPAKVELQRRVARERLTNVRFLPAQPRSVIARVMPLWRAGVVPLVSLPLSAHVLPVKLYELMASGVPVIFSGPVGEATDLISRVGCGLATPPGDAGALAEAVVTLCDDEGTTTTMAARGRAEAVRTLSRTNLARTFVTLATADL